MSKMSFPSFLIIVGILILGLSFAIYEYWNNPYGDEIISTLTVNKADNISLGIVNRTGIIDFSYYVTIDCKNVTANQEILDYFSGADHAYIYGIDLDNGTTIGYDAKDVCLGY